MRFLVAFTILAMISMAFLPTASATHAPDAPIYLQVSVIGADFWWFSAGVDFSAHDTAGHGFTSVTFTLDGTVTPINSWSGSSWMRGNSQFPSTFDHDDGACHTFGVEVTTTDGRTAARTIKLGGCWAVPPEADGGTRASDYSAASEYNDWWNGGTTTGITAYGKGNTVTYDATWSPEPSSGTKTTYGYYTYNRGADSLYCGTVTHESLVKDWGSPTQYYKRVEATFGGSHCGPSNTAPSVDTGPDDWKLPAKEFVLAAPIFDPDPGETWTVAIDWGDGTNTTYETAIPTIFATHKYPGTGNWTITVCVTDSAGETGCDEVANEQRGAHGKLPADKLPGDGKAKGLSK